MAQCTANSKTTGLTCKQPAIPGGKVCRYHGGSAPQVRNAAAARLAAAVDPAVTHLIKAIDNKEHPGVALRAAQDILDRNNMKGENIIRLLMPEGGALPVKLTDDQVSRIRSLSPAEAALLDRVLGFIETGERKPDSGSQPAQ
jgi:hypothetical protein